VRLEIRRGASIALSREQDLSGQLAELRAAGCAKVYSEKASGARGNRAELRKVIERLQARDLLVVTRLDRLPAPRATCSTSSKT
jgi:DNA invertase Pin-like site-specific DNA recombinase